MIEELYFPKKIDEKFKERFIKNTLKLGEDAYFEGFLLRFPEEQKFRKLLWERLSPSLGNFKIKLITPFPERGFPAIPVVIPSWLSSRVSVGSVEGKIYDLSMFSSDSGRFILAEKITKIKLEDYMQFEKSGLNSKNIYEIFDSTFSEFARDVFASYFLSSPQYLGRVGGNALSLLNTNSKYYASNFKPFFSLLSSISDILRKDSFNVTLSYEDEIKINVAPKFRIRYEVMSKRSAKSFYSNRKAKVWEKSAITESDIKFHELIKYSDIPYIPAKEEVTIVDDSYLRDYSLDLGFYAFENHLKNPEVDEDYIINFKKRLIKKIGAEFPHILEAMQLGIIMDISDVNGFGEHGARVLSAWERMHVGNEIEKITDIYLTAFERIDDVLGKKIENELATLKMRSRRDKIINRVLWELNQLKPNGWTYEYFEMKMAERGIDNGIDKIFGALRKDGLVIMKRKERYIAVANV